MTKILKVDIGTASRSRARELVKNDGQEATNLKNAIRSFIDESKSNNKLTGDVWELARTRLEKCCDALEKRTRASETLLSGIDAANNKMTEYLNLPPSCDDADDSELPEYKEQLKQAKIDRENTAAALAVAKAGHTTTVIDPNTGKSKTVVEVDKDKVGKLEADLAVIDKLIEDLEAIIKKLEQLKSYDAEATSLLNTNFESGNTAYKAAISNLQNM